jgi:predicted SAM-dependent methyltransferase
MPRYLHLGGTIRTPGWEVFNAVPGDYVDHVGNANDLSRFPDGTFAELYGSHIVEHFDYKNELIAALKEWYRVLAPGGKLYISVPDLDILCPMILDRRLTEEQRFMAMRILFGGHADEWDYHKVGLNQDFLTGYLTIVGFKKIEKVREFGLFRDTSSMHFAGRAISLNIIAYK